MATYAVYHVFHVQIPYQPTTSNKYLTHLFVIDAPGGVLPNQMQRALAQGGYDFDLMPSNLGRPWLDLAWSELVIARLKNAPPEVVGDWQKNMLKKVPWDSLQVDMDTIDPD